MVLQGRVAIVTGGSKGIGAAIAKGLAQEGAKLFVNYYSDRPGAEATLAAIRAVGGDAEMVQADVSVVQDARVLIDRAADTAGRLDIVINNAAICEPVNLDDIGEEHVDRTFQANFKAALFVSQSAVRRFGSEGGNIVNVSSLNGRRPAARASVYSASKAALEALTIALAGELGPKRIRVNAVAPGATDTAMLRGIMTAGSEAAIIAQTALGRLGTPADIAGVVVFLVSHNAPWITGQVITASGGL